jgi:putative DNA primase/helicase
MNQYKGRGGADRAFWLEAFNGNSFTVDRVKFGVNGSIRVPSLSIPVIGGIQPDKLQKALFNDTDDGLAARFMYVWPEPVPPRKPSAYADNEQALNALLKLQKLALILNEKEQPVSIPITLEEPAIPHFEEYRQDAYQEEQSASGLYLSYLGKNGGRALRLALILEMLWWSAGDNPHPPASISKEALLYPRNAHGLF